jgi:hypothetical protein
MPSSCTPSVCADHKPKNIKLTYFDIKGVAESIRLAFTVGGIQFEDERLTREQFTALKPTLPFLQVSTRTSLRCEARKLRDRSMWNILRHLCFCSCHIYDSSQKRITSSSSCTHACWYSCYPLGLCTLQTQVPLLTVNGETVAQSAAILRYAGKLSGLYPLNYIEAAKCDAVLDSIADMNTKLRPSMLEKDEVLQLMMLSCARFNASS